MPAAYRYNIMNQRITLARQVAARVFQDKSCVKSCVLSTQATALSLRPCAAGACQCGPLRPPFSPLWRAGVVSPRRRCRYGAPQYYPRDRPSSCCLTTWLPLREGTPVVSSGTCAQCKANRQWAVAHLRAGQWVQLQPVRVQLYPVHLLAGHQ